MIICVLAILAITLAIGCAPPAWSDFEFLRSAGAATASSNIYDIHMVVLWCCVGIALVVYAAMIVAIVRYRRPAGARAPTFRCKTWAEVIWTLIPAAIMIGMSLPAVEMAISMKDQRSAELAMQSSIDQPRHDSVATGRSHSSRLELDKDRFRPPDYAIDAAQLGR